MQEIIMDTWIDSLKLLPFLFITYLIMEYIEHRMGERTKKSIEKSGRLGPVFGGIIGAFPQCGFSAAASNLYAGRVITPGTLIAVFLSTSDEMLPILISEQADASMILKLLGIKAVIGIAAGILVDLLIRRKNNPKHTAYRHGRESHMDMGHLWGHECCSCENGIFKSALNHTLHIFFFILIISFALNGIIFLLGEEFLMNLILNKPVIGQMIAGLVGLIPNCASSVLLTQLYLEGVMGPGAVMAGLLAGSGVGLLVLFRVNDNIGENVKILGLLYGIGVFSGLIIDISGIVI